MEFTKRIRWLKSQVALWLAAGILVSVLPWASQAGTEEEARPAPSSRATHTRHGGRGLLGRRFGGVPQIGVWQQGTSLSVGYPSGGFTYYQGPGGYVQGPGGYGPVYGGNPWWPGCDFGYSPYWYDPYWYAPLAPPPLFLPAETMYGPQSVRRFMGLDTPQTVNVSPAPAELLPEPQEGGFGVLAPGKRAAALRPNVRVSNEAARARCWRFIGQGDVDFQALRFSQAWSQYKKAISAAPDVAEAWLRQGLSLVPMHKYPAAASAIERAVALDADLPHSGFQLDTLYGGNALLKENHWEELANAAAANPTDSDLVYLLGVQLYFDGQQARAVPFLKRAERLSTSGDAHVEPFLKAIAPQRQEF